MEVAMSDMTPFRIEVSEAALADLRDRLGRTRWPDELPDTGWSRGIPPSFLRRLAEHWREGFEWRGAEARLNLFPQSTSTIDGQTIHFMHVRSAEPKAVPIILIHGWPSSPAEFAELIGPLTDPRAHGGDPADAFHVVAPSLPGFGFSRPLSDKGWGLGRTTKAFAELMRRLGYESYFAHGGDIGAGIAGMLASLDPDHVRAVHVVSDPTSLALIEGLVPGDLSGFTEEEKAKLEALKAYGADGRGYLQIQGTRPVTIGYGLTDSPVAQLAWIAEKVLAWEDIATPPPNARVDRDKLLTTVSIYWFTGTGASSANFVYEASHAFEWPQPSSVPQGWAVFSDQGIVRRVIDPERKVEHWSEYPVGGHFPALSVPDVLASDLRTFFRRYR
jgi:pimeloyl-ACP methyl ester carboxylesterase